MAIDIYLLDRIRNILERKNIEWTEKRMFGGLCIMVDGKMCLGTFHDGLMARVNPVEMDELLKKVGASQMTMGNKKMKGFIEIEVNGYDSEDDLEYWVQKCLAFNPLVQASKK